MKKKILLLYDNQYGYHTDTYMYSKYLNKQKYDVHYFCFELGLPKVELEYGKVNYVKIHASKLISYLNFFFQLYTFLRKEKFDLIFQVDDKFSLLIRILNLFQPFVFDIRTGDLSENKFRSWFKNFQITFTSFFYKHVSVISKSLKEKLKLKKSTVIIPLGGELLPIQAKKFESIRLLYLGSLNCRSIHETIYGLSLYLNQNNANQNVAYDILGFGKDSVIDEIKEAILKTNLQDKVFFHGHKKIDELLPFFENCNVGVVYIPQTKWYDCQPATKLYECVLAGMPVIATNTTENRLALKNNCGVITEDNSFAFADSLKKIIDEKSKYDSIYIREMYKEFEWSNIVKYQLEPFFDEILKSGKH